MEKSYTVDDVERIYKVKYEKVTQNGRKIKSKVTPDAVEHGIDFLLAETERKLMIAKKAHSWGNKELFDNFAQCLKGQTATIWEEVLADKYPDKDALTTQEFNKPGGALDAFHTRLLNCENGQDMMLHYLERNI